MLVYPEGAVMVEAVVKDQGGMILDDGAECLQPQDIKPGMQPGCLAGRQCFGGQIGAFDGGVDGSTVHENEMLIQLVAEKFGHGQPSPEKKNRSPQLRTPSSDPL